MGEIQDNLFYSISKALNYALRITRAGDFSIIINHYSNDRYSISFMTPNGKNEFSTKIKNTLDEALREFYSILTVLG